MKCKKEMGNSKKKMKIMFEYKKVMIMMINIKHYTLVSGCSSCCNNNFFIAYYFKVNYTDEAHTNQEMV